MFNDAIIGFISSLIVPDLLYAQAQDIAITVATRISPVLIVVAIAIRSMTTQIDTTAEGGNGVWAKALRDVFVWGTVFSLYFGIVSVVGGFMQSSYTIFNEFGSLKSIMDQLSRVMTALETKSSEDASLFSIAGGQLWSFIGGIFYYLSLLLVVTIVSFFHLAQALGFGACFIFGLIAIPLSITSHIKLLRGWALFFGFILFWPIMEAIALGLIGGMFGKSIEAMVSGTVGAAQWEMGSAYMLFTTLNIIVVMVVIAVPFITNSLIANAPAGASLVTPFIGGALATVAAAHSANKTVGGASAKAMVTRDDDGNIRPGAVPRILGGVAHAFQNSLTGDSGPSMKPLQDRVEPTLGDPVSSGANTSADSASDQQARRGAIINQQQAQSAVTPEGKA